MTAKEIGDWGEQMAAEYLEDNGYEIEYRNFKIKAGEIDIIAKNGGCTVFVEVKTRKSNLFGEPSEYVNFRKIDHIKKTALVYLGSLDKEVRFDVIEIIYSYTDGEFFVDRINHIEDAF